MYVESNLNGIDAIVSRKERSEKQKLVLQYMNIHTTIHYC